ncbi:putative PilZ domain protein [uncultured delta proteobacterium]|uniref:Putative PilZ domain protein n=1 Tax=uncultured delta proteobacterium TaxID=34034 RepID=A0A212JKX7_9DELT|nr:putative PilZ domain protein [uncultured delta proteobacterium]
MDDRRNSPRIPLDAPCLLTLLVNYEEEHHAMVVDVSRGGVQLALSPGPGLSEVAPGMPVTLQNVPAPLNALLEGIHGKVAWVGVRCCGVKLNKELAIDSADITDLSRL